MSASLTVISRDRRFTSRRMSTLLVCCLLVASLLALYEVAQLRQPSSNATTPSRSIQTIQRFYAGLNEYLETGELGAVMQTLAPGALAFVPEHGAMGDESELMTYLLALRSTHPQLRFTVDRIDAGDDIAIASVRRSDTNGARGASQEFFRVRDGRIMQHWSTETRSTLVHPILATPTQVGITYTGHLAIAEITFSPHKSEMHPIDGPALLVVHRGRVTLTGDGSSQILDIPTGASTMPAPNERAPVGPGQAILISRNRANVQNDSPGIAVARIATVVEDHQQSLVNYPADRQPPPPAINHISMLRSSRTTTYGSATIRPLAFDDRAIPAGKWELEIAWAVMGPGASLSFPAAGESALLHVISGPARNLAPPQDAAESPNALINIGEEPLVALVIRLREVP